MINSANEYEPGPLNTFCATRTWKLKILQRMYELISTFATQRFSSFWETISPWILDRKSQIFQHVFIFTSSLTFWSQFISNMFSSARKAVCKWAKCKPWREQRSSYSGYKPFLELVFHFLIYVLMSLTGTCLQTLWNFLLRMCFRHLRAYLLCEYGKTHWMQHEVE